MKRRFLDGKGKGMFIYDYKYDTLTFKVKDRDYKKSVEFQNFTADIDKENFVTGVRIFDVSKVFNMNKHALKNIVNGKFDASIENNVITIRIEFVGKLRNKIIPIFSKEKDFVQQITTPIVPGEHLIDSQVACVAL